MQTTCPQCGKVMNVSPEELSVRDGLVVCPQCLNAYQAIEPGTLPRPHSPQAETADETEHMQPPMRYCPHCGQSIGEGINFCPYCGKALNAASDSTETISNHDTGKRHQSSRRSHEHGTHTSTLSDTGFDWKPMIPSYRLAQHRHREPASPAFQAFAIAVIMGLLALLAFIIYRAIQLP